MIAFLQRQWRQPGRMNAGLALVCFALVALALLLEWVGGMAPCPLCVFQRIVFIAIGVVLLAGTVLPGRSVAVLAGLAGLAGIGLAGRHLWLQSLPADQVPACGPGLDYLMGLFPVTEVITLVLSGSGECAEVDRVLGVSIPAWTLLAYGLIAALAIAVNVRGRRPVAGP